MAGVHNLTVTNLIMEVVQGCYESYKSYRYGICKFQVIYCVDELDEICSCHLNTTNINQIHFFKCKWKGMLLWLKQQAHNKMIGQDRQWCSST